MGLIYSTLSATQSKRIEMERWMLENAARKVLPQATKAFAVPELLEMILLYLPMRDLLLAERVCKEWQGNMQNSPNIQRALFFRPASSGVVSYIDWRLDDEGWYLQDIPLLSLGLPLRGPKHDQIPTQYIAHWGKSRTDAGQWRVCYNTLLANVFPCLAGKSVLLTSMLENLPEAAAREDASWRKMYFTQPPVHVMAIGDVRKRSHTHRNWIRRSVRKGPEGGGLTMMDFLNRLEALEAEGGFDELTWIEGRDLWEAWSGSQDLQRVQGRIQP
ncbi:hypothetical protein LTR17_005920 [Elasticomyces elasticus]|nr:hypothetical protein LTR17_005920 [Elasticomyces elasticus]